MRLPRGPKVTGVRTENVKVHKRSVAERSLWFMDHDGRSAFIGLNKFRIVVAGAYSGHSPYILFVMNCADLSVIFCTINTMYIPVVDTERDNYVARIAY